MPIFQVLDHLEGTPSTPAGLPFRCVFSAVFGVLGKSHPTFKDTSSQARPTVERGWRSPSHCSWGGAGLGVGGWRRLSGCLDRLDKDIKGKQKAALWRGHRLGQTRLFSTQVGVSVQGDLSCSSGGRCWSAGCATDTDLSQYVWLSHT